MNFFNSIPKKDDPFSKNGFMAGIAKMAYAWRTLTINGGKLTWSGLGVPTITIDGYGGNGPGTSGKSAYALTISRTGATTTATLSNLYSVYKGYYGKYQAGTLATTSLDAADTVYLGVELTLATGVTTLIHGTAFTDVSESAAPTAATTKYKRALYVLASTVDDAGRTYSVAVDLRNQPSFWGYV